MKKMKRLFTAMLTALCMIVALLPTTAFAQENVFYVGTESELIAAVNQINAADGGEFVIKLSDNISANKKIEFLKNKTTLYGQGYTLIPNGGLSVKNEGAVLNLGSDDGADSLVISGENSRRTTAMISCENAILNMYSGVVIKDADNGGGAAGSGVFVFGTFNMYGGTITGCDGSMIGLGGLFPLIRVLLICTTEASRRTLLRVMAATAAESSYIQTADMNAHLTCMAAVLSTTMLQAAAAEFVCMNIMLLQASICMAEASKITEPPTWAAAFISITTG